MAKEWYACSMLGKSTTLLNAATAYSSLAVQALIFVIASSVEAKIPACDKVTGSTCACKMSDGSGTFDVSTMVEERQFAPLHVPSDHQSTVYYSPCVPLKLSSPCSQSANAAVCLTVPTSTTPSYTPVATERGVVFSVLPGPSPGSPYIIQLNYSGMGQQSSFTSVNYHCSSFEEVQITNDPRSNWLYDQFILNVTTNYACLKKPKTSSGHGLSVGSILCITFTALVFVYFVGGAIFLIKFREKSGSEAIPNYAFWRELPGLIKNLNRKTISCVPMTTGSYSPEDGIYFASDSCRSSRSSYEKL